MGKENKGAEKSVSFDYISFCTSDISANIEWNGSANLSRENIEQNKLVS